MPKPNDAEGRQNNLKRDGAKQSGSHHAAPSSGARRVRPGDTSGQRRVSPGDTSGHRRVAAGDTSSHRRVSPGDTSGHRRVSPGDTSGQRRISPGDTSGHRRVAAGDTSSHRRIDSKGANDYRRSSPADTTASLSTGAHAPKRIKSRSAALGKGEYRPSHAAARKRKGIPIWIIILVLLGVVGVGVGGFFLIRNLHRTPESTESDGREVTVIIPEGSTGTDIVNILLEEGVIHSKSEFKKALKAQNADQSLQSGAYTFITGSDCAEVVAQLVAGPNSSHGQLQIPEGLTITQTAKIVQEDLGISEADFIAQAKASNYVADYSFLEEAGDDSLEGFLYPKTYDCAGREMNADSVIRLMLTQYEQEMNQLDLAGARKSLSERYSLSVTNYDILKIASIIEKEAINEDDRPKVSSVFYNRLAQNIAIQSDATMGYVTGGEVSTEDLKVDNPYNTYYYKGLPPTPICSPSLWAIQAAMNPADTQYLFFFILEDEYYSNHTFSETYEEHQEAFSVALEEQAAAREAATGGGE